MTKELRRLEIASKIRNARIVARLTQAQVAEKIGVTYQAISNYERGKNAIESDILVKLCEIYGIEPMSILSDLYTCPVCGLLYDSSRKAEIAEHNYRHERFINALKYYGICYTQQECAKIKSEAYDVLHSSDDELQKYDAALNLIKVYFSRSISANNLSLDHPRFHEYAAMLLNQIRWSDIFGKSTYDKLVSEFGKKPGLSDGQTTCVAQTSTFGPSKDAIFPNELTFIKKYRKLDAHGKKIVDYVLDEEIARIESNPPKIIELYPMRHFYQPASAGLGDFNDDSSYKIVDLVMRPPSGSSFLVSVHGDSMEPSYKNGDILFIRAQSQLKVGDIGLFAIGPKMYIKEFGEKGLISHNPQYADILPTEDEPITIQGKVLGVCTKEYLK